MKCVIQWIQDQALVLAALLLGLFGLILSLRAIRLAKRTDGLIRLGELGRRQSVGGRVVSYSIPTRKEKRARRKEARKSAKKGGVK